MYCCVFSCSEFSWWICVCICYSHFELTPQTEFLLVLFFSQDVCNSESELGRFPFSPFKPVLVHGDASDVRVQLRDLNNNWVARSSCKKVSALSLACRRCLVLLLITRTLYSCSKMSRQTQIVTKVLSFSRCTGVCYYLGSLTERLKTNTENIQ